jgi:hypothetical protein
MRPARLWKMTAVLLESNWYSKQVLWFSALPSCKSMIMRCLTPFLTCTASTTTGTYFESLGRELPIEGNFSGRIQYLELPGFRGVFVGRSMTGIGTVGSSARTSRAGTVVLTASVRHEQFLQTRNKCIRTFALRNDLADASLNRVAFQLRIPVQRV